MPYLLDTCAILFVAENTTDLSAPTLHLIDVAQAGEVFVSAISVAEIACLQERGRITLKQHWRTWWDSTAFKERGHPSRRIHSFIQRITAKAHAEATTGIFIIESGGGR